MIEYREFRDTHYSDNRIQGIQGHPNLQASVKSSQALFSCHPGIGSLLKAYQGICIHFPQKQDLSLEMTWCFPTTQYFVLDNLCFPKTQYFVLGNWCFPNTQYFVLDNWYFPKILKFPFPKKTCLLIVWKVDRYFLSPVEGTACVCISTWA